MPITVGQISITSIKGSALQQPHHVNLQRNGVPGNRRFYLIDQNGLLVNGKRAGKLVQLHADYIEDSHHLSVKFPDGKQVAGTATLTDTAVITNFYGRDVKGVLVHSLWNSALSEIAGMPVQLVYADPNNTAADVHPVTLISAASLEYARTIMHGPASGWGNRFRMLFELKGLKPFEEETWANQKIAIGGAMLKVIGPVPRCVITTQNPNTGVPDFKTLHALKSLRETLVQQNNAFADPLPDSGRLMLGMYATVERPGQISLGNAVTRLD